MKNKHGQFMALYLPIMTLFMIALVIGMYWIQNSSLDNHMVSPVRVLELEDAKELFGISERGLAAGSAQFISLRDSDFPERMEEEFCNSFGGGYGGMNDFLSKDLIFQGKKDVGIIDGVEFCRAIYDFEFDDVKDVVVLMRKDIGKYGRLEAIKKDKINFVVDFEWDLAESYEIPEREIKIVFEGGG